MEVNWKKLENLIDAPENLPKGKGWFKFKEFLESANIGTNRAYRIISNGMKRGEIEMHKGSEWNSTHKQRTRSTWYRFISNK